MDHLNTMDQYLAEISQVPLLTVEEEVDLGLKVQRGLQAAEKLATLTNLSVEEIRQAARKERAKPEGLKGEAKRLFLQVQEGEQAREALIQANLRLVVSTAKRYAGRGLPLEDLIQEGNLGLMRAAEKFDPSLGYKFSTYATWWIEQAIDRGLARNTHAVRLPLNRVQELRQLAAAQAQMEQELGREASREELARALGWKESKVELLLEVGQPPLSLDEPVRESEDTPYGDLIPDTRTPSPFEVATKKLAEEEVLRAVESLPDRKRAVVSMRYGFEGEAPKTLKEVGEVLGVTRERARQLEKAALAELRERVAHLAGWES
ncbi:MAG: sigma-70 family RNA polymerase sigma factor [Thermus sp.]